MYDAAVVEAAAAEASDGCLVEGSPYIAMEFASRGTLRDRQPLSWPSLRNVLLALLNALAHAHARGVVHRDIEPANVLVCGPEDLRPGLKLADFGIAHALERTVVTLSNASAIGTLHYMAPEQIRTEEARYGPWTDLYAVGNLAWHLAAGQLPFARLTGMNLIKAQLRRPLPPLDGVAVPDGFREWLQRATQMAPWDRLQRAADAEVIEAARQLRRVLAPSERFDHWTAAAAEAWLTQARMMYDKAIWTGHSASSSASCASSPEPVQQGLALAQCAVIFARRGHHADARQLRHDAVRRLRRAAGSRALAECWRLVGTTALIEGSHKQAEEALARGLKLFKRMRHLAGQARCLAGLGRTAARRGAIELAEERYKGAIHLYELTGSSEVVGPQLDLAAVQLRTGRYRDAQALLTVVRMGAGCQAVTGSLGCRCRCSRPRLVSGTGTTSIISSRVPKSMRTSPIATQHCGLSTSPPSSRGAPASAPAPLALERCPIAPDVLAPCWAMFARCVVGCGCRWCSPRLGPAGSPATRSNKSWTRPCRSPVLRPETPGSPPPSRPRRFSGPR